jgi:hypothetical protein
LSALSPFQKVGPSRTKEVFFPGKSRLMTIVSMALAGQL